MTSHDSLTKRTEPPICAANTPINTVNSNWIIPRNEVCPAGSENVEVFLVPGTAQGLLEIT